MDYRRHSTGLKRPGGAVPLGLYSPSVRLAGWVAVLCLRIIFWVKAACRELLEIMEPPFPWKGWIGRHQGRVESMRLVDGDVEDSPISNSCTESYGHN
jgi:hypothetical protein